jgi:hypothetical protein
MNKNLIRFSGNVVMVSMLSMSLGMPAAHASMISSEQVLAGQNTHEDRDRLRTLFDRADVRKQLQARGVDVNEAQARVDALTDSEVATISGQLGTLPAGGDDEDDVLTMIVKFALLLMLIMMATNPGVSLI